jgi:hypothetical protein
VKKKCFYLDLLLISKGKILKHISKSFGSKSFEEILSCGWLWQALDNPELSL